MNAGAVERAVEILRAGGLVAIPTETVYGLAADPENPDAVARLYAVKGRPADHPLILHALDIGACEGWAVIDERLHLLAARFWPGPLTVVAARGARTPASITGGQNTVALRSPAHPLARAILAAFGAPLVAPSANRFGRVSPTTADHVRADLGTDVDLIVDGGAAVIGVESTIVDSTSAVPAILRTGAVGAAALSDALGVPVVVRAGGDVRVPGSLPSHYAPRARLVIVDAHARETTASAHARGGRRVGLLTLPSDPAAAARSLYASLRALDDDGFEVIVATLPEDVEDNAAVRDRLMRAAAPR